MIYLASCLYPYIIAPTEKLRKEPSEKSEVVSEAFFSEPVVILEEKEDWIKVETPCDSYTGWIRRQVVHIRRDPFAEIGSLPVAKINRLAAHLYESENTMYGPLLTLPFESRLEAIELNQRAPDSRWIAVKLPDNRQAFIQRGDVTFDHRHLKRDEISVLSMRFLNLPYTWGGRSSFGYDCSGFTQMLYRQMGIAIPRDSKDQIEWEGFQEATPSELMPGDLVFFGLDDKRIIHVGMMIDKERFIHATVAENAPYIRVSELSKPIWNGSGSYPFRAFRTLKKI